MRAELWREGARGEVDDVRGDEGRDFGEETPEVRWRYRLWHEGARGEVDDDSGMGTPAVEFDDETDEADADDSESGKRWGWHGDARSLMRGGKTLARRRRR